jgi:hypothetical protein
VSALELIQDKWEKLAQGSEYRMVASALRAGLANIKKWYSRMDDTDAYIMSMALNPVLKFAFIKISWDKESYNMAMKILEENVSFFFT